MVGSGRKEQKNFNHKRKSFAGFCDNIEFMSSGVPYKTLLLFYFCYQLRLGVFCSIPLLVERIPKLLGLEVALYLYMTSGLGVFY